MSAPVFAGLCAIAVAALALPASAFAAGAPGEDPIAIAPGTHPLSGMIGARAPESASVPLQQRSGAEPGSRARVARFEAQAFNIDSEIDSTASVVQQAAADGVRKVCVTEIASGTTSSGPRGDQVVVIRGNIINVCR